MDLKLKRIALTEHGIFGELIDEDGNVIAVTCERAYPNPLGGWKAKLPYGNFVCKRGTFQLHSGSIETFEVMDVPGHDNILFHRGNKHTESDGCILLGVYQEDIEIRKSRIAFEEFLEEQEGLDEFNLTVE